MKVLHLPINVASQMSVTIKGLLENNVQARGLVTYSNKMQSEEKIFHLGYNSANKKVHLESIVRSLPVLLQAIQETDLIHWHFGETALPKHLDLHWASLLKKPGVVEYWGSDIRVSKIEREENPYYKRIFDSGEYPYPDDDVKSRKRQLLFHTAGIKPVISCYSLQPYLIPETGEDFYFVRQRINTKDYTPRYPNPAKIKPLIVHSPSNLKIKGTDAVLTAVERLRGTHEFDFELISGVDHKQAIERMSRADIFIDQLIGGAHGVAALEALALGKPVVCYIKPSMVGTYPAEFPIVNANIDNLTDVLKELIVDGQRRYQVGQAGRAYVEKYHDASKIAVKLVEIYDSLLQKQRLNK